MRIENSKDLQSSISELEVKKYKIEKEIVVGLENIRESVKPLNIVKNITHKFNSSKNIKEQLVNATLGIGAGILTRKIISQKFTPRSLPKNMLLNALQLGVTSVVALNMDKIKAYSTAIYNNIFRKE